MTEAVTNSSLSFTEPFTSYKIWVKAFTWRFEGAPSRTIEIRTDVQGPSAPYIVNLTCSSLDSLFLQWERPSTFYNEIDYYFVYYRSEASWEFEEIALSAGRGRMDHEVSARPIATRHLHLKALVECVSLNENLLLTRHLSFPMQILIANLTADTLYEVKVQGASRSIVENSRIYRGEFSEPRKVVLQSKCESKCAALSS